MGQYTTIREECVIRPSYIKHNGKYRHMKMTIGDHVYIDRDCVICAFKIGNNVQIGKNCVIGHRAVIHDNTKILDNSVIGAEEVVPPFTVYGGRPAMFVAELSEGVEHIHKEFAINYYHSL